MGGGRTALFNWLFAKQQRGTMVLRIEDTDAERNKPELVEGILVRPAMAGAELGRGPVLSVAAHRALSRRRKKCLANGTAFLCYCPAEKYVGGDHAEDGTEGGQVRRVVRCSCRDGNPINPGTKPAIRFKVPIGGKTTFYDVVFGDTEFSNDDIEDFMLLRSGQVEEFGQPMYQLSVVVDDIDMRITHVIRGADHLSNTPKQVLLYRALDAKPPIFAHLPLILGPDRKRLSKRHGATSVSMYRDEGFLPEAFQNFLALLGWAPGGDVEFMRTPELIERFKLEGVTRTNGVFDKAKLEWFNTQYLQKLPIEDLVPQVQQELRRSGLWKEEWASGSGHEWFTRTVDLLRPRVRLLPDFSTWSRAFFSDDFAIDPAAEAKFWKDPKVPDLLAKLADALGRAAGVESRRLRSCVAGAVRSGRREGRITDQRHTRGHRRPGRRAAAVRHHGGPGTRPRGETFAGRRAHCRSESLRFFTAFYRGDFLVSAWSFGLFPFLSSLSGP